MPSNLNNTATYFKESQFLGLNYFSIIIRMVIALFCFTAYYWSENPQPVYTDIGNIRIGSYPGKEIPNSGEIFFLIGNVILVFSVILIFVRHMKLSLNENYLIIERLWSRSIIKIDVASIKFVRKTDLKNIYVQRAVFNLHKKDSVKFYTNGDEAVELVDKDNMRYIIGTQKAGELINALNVLISKQP
jgi:hypothetical protein